MTGSKGPVTAPDSSDLGRWIRRLIDQYDPCAAMRKVLRNQFAKHTNGAGYDYYFFIHISISVIKSCEDSAV